MVSRRSIMAQIRKNVTIESAYTFSESRKTHQRVKLWLVSNRDETAQNIRNLVEQMGWTGITVETIERRFEGWMRTGSGIAIRFDHSVYSK